MIRSCLIVETIVLAFLGGAAVVAAQVHIDSPRPGAVVEVETIVNGRVSDPKAQVYVLVRPSGDYRWWVQPIPAPANRDGFWQTLCYFGTTEAGIGEDYQIVATISTSKLKEGQTLAELPKDAVYSRVVRVKRGQNNVQVPEFQIDSPHQEAEVGSREIVRGRISDPAAHVYVLVRPVRTPFWWVQPIPEPPNRDGSWETLAYFGLPHEGKGEYFEVIALVTEKRLKEGERFDTLPRYSARSAVVRVRRTH